MMLGIEILSLCFLAALCFICTKSDLKDGMIYNRTLAVFLGLAVVIDSIYYGFFVRDLFKEFIINFLIIVVVSLYMFYTHSFAGGDCKMLMVIALLFPARFYWVMGNTNTTLVFAIGFAIFAGYCYLLGNSIWSIATKKTKITGKYIKSSLLGFAKSYITAIVYISFLNQILMLISHKVEINIWIIRLLCLIVAGCIGKYPVFKKLYVFLTTAFIVVILSLALRMSPISLRLENYVLVIVLLICQMTIKTTLYENINVDELKKGMILSTFSSMMMQTSITKGLPGISTEDLKSRLTENEIESIKIWAKATRVESLSIVKKIPFAIFISIGMVMYCAIWGILK